jgi:hypothetical protein
VNIVVLALGAHPLDMNLLLQNCNNSMRAMLLVLAKEFASLKEYQDEHAG